MTLQFFAIKNYNGHYVPSNESDYESSKKIKANEEVTIMRYKPRNLQFHKKYFAMLKCILFHLPESLEAQFTSVEDIRREMKFLTGYYDHYVSLSGTEHFQLKSMQFAKMDDDAFDDFYHKSLDMALKYFLPDTHRDAFVNEILEFL